MNLKDLSQKTGFTKSYLSQIENMKREPPISTLSKIAFVLNVDVAFLISGETQNTEAPKITVVRKGEGRANYGPFGEKGFLYESLGYKKFDRLMDAYIITIGPEFPPKAFFHEGQEFVYVLEGAQEFIYDGQTYFFEEGDCFFFDSDKPHYSRTVGKKQGKILMVFAVQKASAPGELLSLNKIEMEK
ncbi:MAG: hypothetical protein A2V65_08040 [Deltaproteobacteria bacterium RBG_13_49_15]|nr:MAG: hypothetical protein A2V65_08040 [Deltaproteobacteria bacterium RBG_13_49_15]